mmetsp:Transcript_26511/g.60915  ORF Transcript_26511/g.60915 Transcript_26511/m.60915 type:complete len:204 (-) Transcript_26511:9-620(-)
MTCDPRMQSAQWMPTLYTPCIIPEPMSRKSRSLPPRSPPAQRSWQERLWTGSQEPHSTFARQTELLPSVVQNKPASSPTVSHGQQTAILRATLADTDSGAFPMHRLLQSRQTRALQTPSARQPSDSVSPSMLQHRQAPLLNTQQHPPWKQTARSRSRPGDRDSDAATASRRSAWKDSARRGAQACLHCVPPTTLEGTPSLAGP